MHLSTTCIYSSQPHPPYEQSMTSLPKLPQPPIIIWQRRKKPSANRHHSSHPEARVIESHHAPSKMVVDQVLRSLHSQHRYETHPHCCPSGHWPRKPIRAATEEDRLQYDGRCDAWGHCSALELLPHETVQFIPSRWKGIMQNVCTY